MQVWVFMQDCVQCSEGQRKMAEGYGEGPNREQTLMDIVVAQTHARVLPHVCWCFQYQRCMRVFFVREQQPVACSRVLLILNMVCRLS